MCVCVYLYLHKLTWDTITLCVWCLLTAIFHICMQTITDYSFNIYQFLLAHLLIQAVVTNTTNNINISVTIAHHTWNTDIPA